MAEMSMSDNNGNEITFERDGTVSAGVTTMCDRCDQYKSINAGQQIKDATGQVIMWFCWECRLEAYIK